MKLLSVVQMRWDGSLRLVKGPASFHSSCFGLFCSSTDQDFHPVTCRKSLLFLQMGHFRENGRYYDFLHPSLMISVEWLLKFNAYLVPNFEVNQIWLVLL